MKLPSSKQSWNYNLIMNFSVKTHIWWNMNYPLQGLIADLICMVRQGKTGVWAIFCSPVWAENSVPQKGPFCWEFLCRQKWIDETSILCFSSLRVPLYWRFFYKAGAFWHVLLEQCFKRWGTQNLFNLYSCSACIYWAYVVITICFIVQFIL